MTFDFRYVRYRWIAHYLTPLRGSGQVKDKTRCLPKLRRTDTALAPVEHDCTLLGLTWRPFDDLSQHGHRLGEGAHCVTPILASDIPFRIDEAQRQTRALPLLRQEPVP